MEFAQKIEVTGGPEVTKFGHLMRGCQNCVGWNPTSDNAEDLSLYDPGLLNAI